VLPASINVAIRGTDRAISDLSAEALAATVDASGLTAGEHATTVRVLAAQGLTIERVEPQTVRLRITKQ
jgi:YbbR domain-containing protein